MALENHKAELGENGSCVAAVELINEDLVSREPSAIGNCANR
jgi:hypothetical protein